MPCDPTYLHHHLQRDEPVHEGNRPSASNFAATYHPERILAQVGAKTRWQSWKCGSVPLCSAHYQIGVFYTGIIPSHLVNKRAAGF